MAEFEIRVELGEAGIATFNWNGTIDAEQLQRAITVTAEDALSTRGLRRLEVALPGFDVTARRAVTRSGFRLEGIRRAAVALPDEAHADVYLYARLAGDVVDGPGGFSGVMNSVLPRKRLIAHVLIRDEADRVLLCDTLFKSDWELPGGIVEPGEPPRVGAEREVLEELGVERRVGGLLVADWMPPYLGWDDAVELIFDGGRISADDLGALVLQPTEINQVRLCTLVEARELVTPLSHRRLTVAAGLRPGEFAYLEDGARP